MLGRIIDKETNTESVLMEKTEVDALRAEIIRLNNQIAFYKLAEFELKQYEDNAVCRFVLSVTVFFRNLFRKKNYIRVKEVLE